MTTYNFDKQLSVGEAGERVIDAVLQLKYPYWTFAPVDMTEQRRGIDRSVMTDGRKFFTLEYKTDVKAAKTGNLFLELEVDGKDGWFWKTGADYIVWYVPKLEKVFIVRTVEIQYRFVNEAWGSVLKKLQVKNERYNASGVAVPLDDVMDMALLVLDVPQRGGDKE